MHRGIYRRLEAGAVVHVHSPWVTTLAVLGRPLPPVHYMLALAGGTVPVAEYATYGIAELAANAVEAMAAATPPPAFSPTTGWSPTPTLPTRRPPSRRPSPSSPSPG